MGKGNRNRQGLNSGPTNTGMQGVDAPDDSVWAILAAERLNSSRPHETNQGPSAPSPKPGDNLPLTTIEALKTQTNPAPVRCGTGSRTTNTTKMPKSLRDALRTGQKPQTIRAILDGLVYTGAIAPSKE